MELNASLPTAANTGVPHSNESPFETALPSRPVRDPDEVLFEMGLWLSGLEGFLCNWDRISKDSQRSGDPEASWVKEFRLTYAALILCSSLNYELRKGLASGAASTHPDGFTVEDCDGFVLELRELIVLNRNLIDSASLKFEAWRTWNQILVDKLRRLPLAVKFSGHWGQDGLNHLPNDLKHLLSNKSLSFSDRADLTDVLARFAIIIRSLSVVGQMLKNDEPLKPTVLVFSKVHERSQDLINFINSRLTRFQDESAELFASLDGASYTASLELKKVYQQELTGLVGIRPAPSIHAKVESAYASLNDSFEQILAGFAMLVDPDVVVTDLFPGIQLKLDRSIELRRHLWKTLKAVQAAETDPQKELVAAVRKELTAFMNEPAGYLFFKDRETLERFTEEVFATTENKDLIPILHRFGAYLETLFGLVNMRTVLASHPFEGK
ncbi:MAG: ABC transporter substrate-binding protein [Acidobacteria bacterium]|nr:ABC transporter substrate-binding protein [Acidobacteriota bacterium]